MRIITLAEITKKLTMQESFVSLQCYLDVQLSCSFKVLLIELFPNHYAHLSIPLLLTGSDSCEIFFSKIGGMQRMERAYDFHKLVSATNTLNHLASHSVRGQWAKFQ